MFLNAVINITLCNVSFSTLFVILRIFDDKISNEHRFQLDDFISGCRYGCICHLCMFTEQSPEADQRVVKCEKEYCRLGCICDSIEGRKDKGKLTNCGKPGCAPECTCDDLSSNKKRCEKYDKDYVPSVQKGNPKYAALPRRESTYRLAKNLDAVSRKALLYYESSEMYADQKKARRRRSKV